MSKSEPSTITKRVTISQETNILLHQEALKQHLTDSEFVEEAVGHYIKILNNVVIDNNMMSDRLGQLSEALEKLDTNQASIGNQILDLLTQLIAYNRDPEYLNDDDANDGIL